MGSVSVNVFHWFITTTLPTGMVLVIGEVSQKNMKKIGTP
jgi:hypothetical protein